MLEAVDPILDILNDVLFVRLAADMVFRSGFCWGLTVALIIGTISRMILYFWAPIKAFFAATRTPASNAGPSPFNYLASCVVRMIILVVLAFGSVWVFMTYFN